MNKNKKPDIFNTRGIWMFNPVERIKPSKKVYSRKNMKFEFGD